MHGVTLRDAGCRGLRSSGGSAWLRPLVPVPSSPRAAACACAVPCSGKPTSCARTSAHLGHGHGVRRRWLDPARGASRQQTSPAGPPLRGAPSARLPTERPGRPVCLGPPRHPHPGRWGCRTPAACTRNLTQLPLCHHPPTRGGFPLIKPQHHFLQPLFHCVVPEAPMFPPPPQAGAGRAPRTSSELCRRGASRGRGVPEVPRPAGCRVLGRRRMQLEGGRGRFFHSCRGATCPRTHPGPAPGEPPGHAARGALHAVGEIPAGPARTQCPSQGPRSRLPAAPWATGLSLPGGSSPGERPGGFGAAGLKVGERPWP